MELISREKLLSYLQSEVHFWKDEDEKVYKVVDIIKFEIEELPIIESRPKGKWETVSREKGACEIFFANKKCSNCGYEYCFPFYYKYCPECGSEMENG